MKRKHIKLPTAGARSLLATILLAAAPTIFSHSPDVENYPHQLDKLRKIEYNYTLPEKDYSTTKWDFSEDNDTVLLGRLVFGEARGSSFKEKVSTAYTAVNRANDDIIWNGRDLRESILKNYQYSCFNNNDPNKIKLMNPEAYSPKSWEESMKAAKGVLEGFYPDPTGGATHYHTKNIRPYWMRDKNLTRVENLDDLDHHFYSSKKGS